MSMAARLALATGLLVGAGPLLAGESEAVKKARKEMEGTWQAVSYALDGKKAPAEDLKKIRLVIDADGKTTAQRDGKTFIASTTKINPAKEPKTIDITFTQGDDRDRTAPGIWKIEGDRLTICRAAPGKARPSEFSSRPGSGLTLMVYRRIKK
jgi:uncharacterized protein (TIGR03067 family)